MSPSKWKPSLVGLLFTTLIVKCTASPLVTVRSQYAEHALRKQAGLDVKATTTTDSNVIDWIPIESQGKIASPPPPISKLSINSTNLAIPELRMPGAQLGPPGTVPVPRVSLDYLESVQPKVLPQSQTSKDKSKSKSKRQYAGNHWYVSSNEATLNLGGKAAYSIYKPFVNNGGDFSLLQTAVTKGDQTLEAGWINYPNQVSEPHLFTYFTTDGYASNADYRGGWNQDVKGWVQVSDEIFPGTVFKPNSVDNGDQYEIEIEYFLHDGNWWLGVLGIWIGYYPASLYSAVKSGDSLATNADGIFFYGEIYQSEGPLTTTDMGSGEYGTTGGGRSAYMHNMIWTNLYAFNQEYTAGFWDSDSGRYNHMNVISSGSDWGSYVFLGGPGAGGVVGG